MRRRTGVVVLLISLFAAGLAAGAIHAGPPLTPTTTTDTTTDTTTQETTTAETTTTVATTTAATTTVATTTAPAAKPKPKPAGKLLSASPLATPRCLLLAGFALVEPGRQPLALGDVAVVPRVPRVAEGGVAYPADGSVLTASSVTLRGRGCGTTANARADVGSLSLFGGAVTVRSVELGVEKGVAGKTVAVTGLVVGRTPVAATPGRPIVIGSWGYVVALAAPDPTQAGALAVHLTKAHAGLPARTILLVGFAQLAPPKVVPHAARPAAKAAPHPKQRARSHAAHRAKKSKKTKKPKRHVRKHRLGDDPLKLTPRLGLTGYAFPVAGDASYVDTYGAYRGDVPGNWHHGDDIFAALGTPVVAVTDGTLNRVGWERLGGWRLWVRDHNRNEFYYAHLSGYSPLALRSRFVKKGDVIGFIGNSGDAFTTSPHLHFEIHPHQLLRLDYNGAVDPTTYLDDWRHLASPQAPIPAHPPFPAGAVRSEARYIWRELLAARGLAPSAPKPSERPRLAVPLGDRAPFARREAAASDLEARHTSGVTLSGAFVGIVLPVLLFAAALAVPPRRDPS